MRALTLALAALALQIAACGSVELTPPRLVYRNGAAARRPLRRVVALPATCGVLLSEAVALARDPRFPPRRCPNRERLQGIDQGIRASLDFQGFQVIDAERVNVVTASRREIEERRKYGAHETSTSTTETHGALFEDATPDEQAEILKDLSAEALLSTRVLIGSELGLSARRTVTVQVRLRAALDGALVWARRCEVEVSALTTDEAAIERAAKCAIEGAR